MHCLEFIADEAAALREERAEADLRAALSSPSVATLRSAIDEPTRVEARLLSELQAADAASRQHGTGTCTEAQDEAKWVAAQERADQHDAAAAQQYDSDDGSSPTTAELERNQVRAQATHDRIMGEARNGCKRVANGSSRFFVTPPINSYYRRLVHELAETHQLAHASIADVGTVFTYNWAQHGKQCQSTCPCTFCLVGLHHQDGGKAVVIAPVGSLDDVLTAEARAQAAGKAPSEGGSIEKRLR